MAIIKGQNLRVFVGDKCIAAATSCQFHVGTSLEESSTKDSTGNWQSQECTQKNWDVSVDALVVDSDAAAETAFDLIDKVGTTVTLKWQQTEGDSNRAAVASGKCKTGSAILSDISVTAANKSNSTYSATFTGIGALS